MLLRSRLQKVGIRIRGVLDLLFIDQRYNGENLLELTSLLVDLVDIPDRRVVRNI
ncbi:hypothetical protein D3C76_1782020 [compost metagenome]